MDLSKSFEVFNPSKYDCRIHIVGCGSVGATVAENLARCGLTKFTLWDFDNVEPHNLANQIFRNKDIGKPKIEALKDIILDINPEAEKDIRLKPKGWNGEMLDGFVILAVDSIKTRKAITTVNFDNTYIRAMFDFRTGLYDAQHFAADWTDAKHRDNFLNTMDFTDEEAKAANPVSACNVELAVPPTIRTICAYGVSNFMNFWNGGAIKKMILLDAFKFTLSAY